MKLSIAAVIILLLSSLVVGLDTIDVAKAQSKTIVVPTDYPTIQQAINATSDGDTIFVRKGVYMENPEIHRSITLIGEDRDTTIIDVTAGLKIERNNVTITGFTIYDGWAGILLSASYCNISANKITDSETGISLFGEYNYVTGNIFQSIGLSAAIKLSYSNNNFVNNNYIDSCTEGIQLREGSSNNIVTANTIVNCQDVAIRLLGSNLGPKWLGPNNNSIMQNNISRSGCGTTIYGANGNIISENNYVYNTVQLLANEDYYLSFGYNRSINTINGNYWSDYNGTDSDGDKIGDTAYVIDDINKDNSPLIQPIDLTSTSPNSTPTPSLTSTPILTPSPTAYPTNSPSSNISPTATVPEFPAWIIPPLTLVTALMIAMIVKKKQLK